MNKSDEKTIIVLAIVGIISLIVVSVVIGMLIFSPDSFKTGPCKTSNNFLELVEEINDIGDFETMFGAVEFQVLESSSVEPMAMCKQEPEIIYADEWDKCNSEYKEMYDFALNDAQKNRAVQKCLSEQVSEKVADCWYMYGEGKHKYVPSNVCFLGGVFTKDKENKDYGGLRENDLILQMQSSLYKDDAFCDFIENNQAEDGTYFDCGGKDEIAVAHNMKGAEEYELMDDSQMYFIIYCNPNKRTALSLEKIVNEFLDSKFIEGVISLAEGIGIPGAGTVERVSRWIKGKGKNEQEKEMPAEIRCDSYNYNHILIYSFPIIES